LKWKYFIKILSEFTTAAFSFLHHSALRLICHLVALKHDFYKADSRSSLCLQKINGNRYSNQMTASIGKQTLADCWSWSGKDQKKSQIITAKNCFGANITTKKAEKIHGFTLQSFGHESKLFPSFVNCKAVKLSWYLAKKLVNKKVRGL